MSTRITEKDLQAAVDLINRKTGLPLAPYSKGDDGKMIPNAGVYLLGFQYGGVSFERMSLKAGCSGQSTIFHTTTKRELYAQLLAFIAGMEEVAK